MYMIMTIILTLLTVLIGLIFFLTFRQYVINVRIRQVLSQGSPAKIFDDKAKEIVKDGVKYYQILKNKHKAENKLIPIPPPGALDIDRKGRISVEVYYTAESGYQYLTDNKDLSTMKPLDSETRGIIINQLVKANSMLKPSLWSQIQNFAIVGMLCIVIIMGMIFWGDLAKPVLEAGQMNAQITQKQGEITELLAQIIQKEQLIKAEGGG